MSPKKPETQYLPRGVNHLGFLEAQLRNLRGFSTLAYELIQNADDAPGADTITFDIHEDALIVDNNGVFSDCSAVGKRPCLWKEDPGKRHYCDFHRFQSVASADKRGEEDTTGAFGIGFIAVYQITDYPELISNGRHWILHEENPEDKRIIVCSGCKQCQRSGLPGTRFILPWAMNPHSPIRRELRAETMTTTKKKDSLAELQASLPIAMIFLKKINFIEIKSKGKLIKRLERVSDQEGLIIKDGDSKNDVHWTILAGSFEEKAEELRKQNPGRIEEKRSHKVQIAIPDKPIARGLLCACLPTEQDTGLPFHINADFFPSSDRKKVILADDYQSRWNRAAIEGASETLASSIDVLPQLCGHKYLWEIIVSVFSVSQAAKKDGQEKAFSCFWEDLYPVLRMSPVVFTEGDKWLEPSGAFLLGSEDEEEAKPIFDMLDMDIVHRDIRSHIFRVRYAEDLKIRRLELEHLIEALRDNGFTERIDKTALLVLLQENSGLFLLYDEILRLLNRPQAKEKRLGLEKNLQDCAIALGRDKALWPIRQIRCADEKTISLFDSLGDLLPFAEDLGDAFSEIKKLFPNFTCRDAIQYLKEMYAKPETPQIPRNLSPKLLEWFEMRKDELNASPPLKKDLANLPIFPGSDGLYPLSNLALPGDFEDPIGFSDFIDLKLLGGRRDFLRELGANPLTLTVYARDHVPRAFKSDALSPEKKRLVVKLLSLELAKIKEEDSIRDTLRLLPIVECTDQEFREPLLVYFSEETVKKVLGNTINFAVLPDEHRLAIAEFYGWLGVAKQPRSRDIIKFIRQLVADKPKAESIQSISHICRYLGERYENEKEPDPTIEALSTIRWLPAKGQLDHWRLPGELFTVFQEYLFASQAPFLDVPLQIQQSATKFFFLIGVKSTPTPDLVAKHLLRCSEQGTDVNPEVYSYLMDKANEQVINRLKGSACLNLRGGRYVSPDKVFWSAHPFGRFRYPLSPEMRKYNDFLAKLGVREAPETKDAMTVLQEICEEYGGANKVLDDHAKIVCFACWKMLAEGLTKEAVSPEEIRSFAGKKRIIPNDRNLLNPPEHIFFEDRAGVGVKFGEFLKHNTIPRTQGAWQAMAAAGVRALSEVIHIQLLESIDSVSDKELEKRIAGRKRQIERVLEPHKEIIVNHKLLESLTCMRATELKIQYELNAFNRRRLSDPETVPAYCNKDDNLLYFVRRNGTTPWTSIARELVLAIAPDADPGLLASGLKDVLSADSEDGAEQILDELGYAPLEIIAEEVVDTQIIGELGGDAAPLHGGSLEENIPEPDKTEEHVTSLRSGEDDAVVPKEPSEKQSKDVPTARDKEESPEAASTTDDALKGIFGAAGVPDTEAETVSGKDSKEQKKHGESPYGSSSKDPDGFKKPKKRKNILRSIVYPEGALTGEETDHEIAAQRNEVDEAGIQHVEKYEKQQGRSPKIMPHHHPGYDIESKDKRGDVVRYIEVKSLSDQWLIGNAVLSKKQFEKAAELGEKYWLYVVETAQEENAQLYCIQNPANRVDQFVFDDRWMALAVSENNINP